MRNVHEMKLLEAGWSQLLFVHIVNNIPVSALHVDCLCVQDSAMLYVAEVRKTAPYCVQQQESATTLRARFLFIMIMIAL